ncbi:MAG: DUF2752 domain-containing protein [Bacteroidetes bacterium]|nr:DUF2752 domain-containing protein [Bacteroidota bacterium]MBU1679338.1 DUF2752 domain-containing protein [Bacteroidota bacterium]
MKKVDVELAFWVSAFAYLIYIDPFSEGHLTLCGFKLLGFESCPGCGLGKSISFLFHGDFSSSIKSHPLGIFGLVVISYRITKLIYKNYINPIKSLEVYNG